MAIRRVYEAIGILAVLLTLAPAAGAIEAIEIDSSVYAIDVWRNTVFWTTDEPGKESLVHARDADDAGRSWVVDVNQLLPPDAAPLARIELRVIDDELYVGDEHQVLALDPESGELRGRWDAPFELYGPPKPPEPGDPGPGKKSDSGCDCSVAGTDAPEGLELLGLFAILALRRRSPR